MAEGNTSLEDGMIVGAKVNPDGSLDLSHAARAIGREIKISDPIVDRLRGPLVIDRKREGRFANFQFEMQKKIASGEIKSWFVRTINEINRPDLPDISPDDIPSLSFENDSPELHRLRTQYGYTFIRPYFKMNLADFKKVFHALTGKYHANGVVVTGGALESDPLTKGVGITLTAGLGPDDEHEIGHSIDPFFDKRSAPEEFLEEVATFYRETYIPRVYVSTMTTTDAQGNKSSPIFEERRVYQNPDKIGRELKDEVYAHKYSKAFKTTAEYMLKVDSVVNILRELERFLPKPDINKAIYNARSEYELSHLLEVSKREKGVN